MKFNFLWLLLLVLLIYIVINLKKYEGYTESQFVDYPGNDIRTFSVISNGDCKTTCSNTPGCVGYVTDFIVGWGPGKCWLKSKMDPTNAKDNEERISNLRY